MWKRSTLLLLVFSLALNACYNKYEQEMIVVSKTPRGDLVGENRPSGELYEQGWYDVGLSRNGQEPIEYIWYVREGYHDAVIMEAEIGEKGIAYIHVQARRGKSRLPRPNVKKPPTIGLWGEVFWDKQE